MYDQKNGSEMIYKKYGYKQALPLLALHSFAQFFMGSVAGYDLFYPETIDANFERRPYSPDFQVMEN